jgi:FkbH-like protein
MFETFFSVGRFNLQPLTRDGFFTFWEEHCTECAVPECYATCPLFDRRKDNRCKRFTNGIESVNGGYSIFFKRWAKLETRVFFIDNIVFILLLKIYINFLTIFLILVPFRSSNRIRNRWWFARHSIQYFAMFLSRLSFSKPKLNILEFTFHLNSDAPKNIVFKLYSVDGKINYSQRIDGQPGINNYKSRIPTVEYSLSLLCSVEIDDSSETEIEIKKLILGEYPDDVKLDADDKAEYIRSGGIVKVMVWDLDNTLWDGVLIESENWKENLKLNPDIINYIKFSDSRGMLHSIASKNDLNQAIEVLDFFGIKDYFLYPQISWGPKSSALLNISRQLNVGLDSLVLIDDSIYEREEVSFNMPSVRCLNSLEFSEYSVHLYEMCANSTMGSERRISYMAESARILARSNSNNLTDSTFLSTLGLNVIISDKFGLFEMDRCFELVQRTNQLNLRTYRYSRDEYDLIFTDPNMRAFHFSVNDKYGDYGLVGFVSFKITKNDIELNDLVISCRVAQKKIEMTVLSKLNSIFGKKVSAKFYPTNRNSILKDVLLETGFKVLDSNGEYLLLEYTENSSEILDFINVELV